MNKEEHHERWQTDAATRHKRWPVDTRNKSCVITVLALFLPTFIAAMFVIQMFDLACSDFTLAAPLGGAFCVGVVLVWCMVVILVREHECTDDYAITPRHLLALISVIGLAVFAILYVSPTLRADPHEKIQVHILEIRQGFRGPEGPTGEGPGARGGTGPNVEEHVRGYTGLVGGPGICIPNSNTKCPYAKGDSRLDTPTFKANDGPFPKWRHLTPEEHAKISALNFVDAEEDEEL